MNFSKDPNWVSKGNKIWTLKQKNRWKERGREILEWGQTCRIPSPSCSLRNILWIPSHQQLPVGGGGGERPQRKHRKGTCSRTGACYPAANQRLRARVTQPIRAWQPHPRLYPDARPHDNHSERETTLPSSDRPKLPFQCWSELSNTNRTSFLYCNCCQTRSG